jgi:diacylglycerol kinase family enzyme
VINVIKGVTQRFHVTVGDTVIDKKITLTCICNGQYYGGGFNPIPEAAPDDGILNILIAEPVSRFQVAKIVGRYANGRYHEFPEIFTYLQGDGMDIKCDREFVINVDGEALFANEVSFKLVPDGINFIFPKNLQPSSAK